MQLTAYWVPSYIKAAKPIIEILKMAGYLLDRFYRPSRPLEYQSLALPQSQFGIHLSGRISDVRPLKNELVSPLKNELMLAHKK